MKKPSILLAAVIASATFAFGEVVEPTTGYVPLANTVRKLKSDKALKVAVIGDSIAYGQMATEVSMQGYPYSTRVTTNSSGMPTGNPMSFARITTDYVKYLAKRDYNVDDVNINTFYSVWGGATAKSSFGYVSDDIIARQPDLVFYEIWNDNDETLRYAENTLRVLWKTLPNTDVVLISVGGAFSKSSVYQPLVTKYGIKWINAYSNVQDWFGQFGVVDSNVYGVVDADGKVSGTRGYLFGNSSPHVNEEGYVWFCDNIVKNLEAFFAAAADKSGALETVAPAGSVDGDPIAATGPEMYHAEIITPASLTQASGSWTLIAREVADEPRDTYDRVKGDAGDRIKAAAADAMLTRSVTGKQLLFRGSENMQYKIGEGEFAAVTDRLIVNLGDDEVTAELTLKATAKDAYINEFYVYGRDYQAITPKATKHRYSVKFYAKIAPEYYHDWHLGGVQVIPHPISWVNCYRMETYGAALTLPGENIISSQCEKNGAFLGWVEAEGVEWNGSEVIPIVTTHEGKTIYAAGATIDPATLGRDVTLVAAYANGPVAKTEADVRKVTFVTENSANMRLLQFSPVYESAMSVTMPDLIPPVAGSTADGWKVINTDTVYPVGAAVPITTDTEFVPVYTKTVVINDELLADCWTFDGTYMTDGTGWKLKASVVGEQLQITAVSAQPADTSVKLDLGRFAVNSAHDTIYYGYLIESNVFKSKTMTCAVDLGLVTKIAQGAFGNTGIVDVRFGPYLVEINSGWANGAFKDCASLTNVVFAQGASATVTPGEAFTFENCTALRSLDCSGIGYLKTRGSNYSQVGGCTALTNVVIRAPSKLDRDFFCSVSSVTYHFYGAAPELTSGALNLGSSSTTYVHLDTNAVDYAAQLTSWNALTEGGAINGTDSTWKSTVVSGGRPLLLYGVTQPEEDLPEEDPPEDPDDPQEDEPDGSYWLYDSANGTVTDTFWTFLASDDGAGNIVFNAHTGVYPDVAGDLDFSKPVKDAANNSYTIVKLNPGFNNDTAGRRIARLVFPAEGVTEIGDNAFNQCTAITNIVNFLPDSVTKVGKYAFYKCPVKQTLYVKGVPRFGTGVGGNNNFSAYAFNSSSITRIVFGPDLKEIFDWDSGPFSYCTALTNVTFDAAMTGAKFSGCRNGGFYGCTALTGTVDLSGFSDLTYIGTLGGNGRVLSGTAVTKVILGAGLEKLHVNFFDQMGSLKEVVFNNAPGAGGFAFLTADANNRANGLMFGGISDAQAVIARIREEDVEAWRPYAQNGEITAIDSTFSESFAGPNYTRRYLVIDGDDEPIGPLGEWIYDDAAGVVSNRLWAFEAEGVLTSLQRVGRCLRYPDTPSVLDFTASITDMRGLPMTILSLDTQFSTAADNAAMSDAGAKVADLRLPGGLVSIKNAAFARLDNCTNVVNFLPDTVTAVGKYAFYKFPVKADLRIRGLVNMGTSNPDAYVYQFGSSKITSVTFGPGFKSLFSWSKSPFNGCTFLTNVTFDAATTDAWFGGIRDDGFYNCTALTGTVDLSGFSNLSYVSDDGGDNNIFSGTKIEHFIVGERCTKLGAGFFSGVSTLKDVTFMGPPPTIETGVNVSGGWLARKASRFFDSNNQSAIKITTCIYKAHRAEWLPYTTATSVDELKRKCNITWKPEYVAEGVDLSLRPFSVVDDSSGMIIICK